MCTNRNHLYIERYFVRVVEKTRKTSKLFVMMSSETFSRFWFVATSWLATQFQLMRGFVSFVPSMSCGVVTLIKRMLKNIFGLVCAVS